MLEGVWERQWLSNNGALLKLLEERLASHLAAQYLSVLANGTLALQVAVNALALSGEVITTPFTFPATPHVLDWAGATPVFADIHPETLTLDPSAVEEAVTVRTSGILGVHVYGMPCDVHALAALADRNGLRIIYDGAHAFGTRLNDVPIGEFGDATMLSFHATKLFHTAEGGALIVRSTELKARVDLLRNFGIQDEVTVLEPGINAKMSELHAALGLLILAQIEAEGAARARIASVYRDRFAGIPGLRMFSLPPQVSDSHQYAVLIVDEVEAGISRDKLYDELKRFNVFARRYFYPLCSETPHYRALPSAAPGNLKVASRISRQVLALPYYGALGESGAHHVADIVLFLLGR